MTRKPEPAPPPVTAAPVCRTPPSPPPPKPREFAENVLWASLNPDHTFLETSH